MNENEQVKSTETKVKGIVQISAIRFFNNGFGIFIAKPIEMEKGNGFSVISLDKYGEFCMKGNSPELSIGDRCLVVAKEHHDEKWGDQYNIVWINKHSKIDSEDNKKTFLNLILTPSQIKILYENLTDPFEVIKNEDTETLTKIKGIGLTKACKLIEKYKETIDYSSAYIELDKLGLTDNMIKKLCERYGSPDLLVEKFKDNPYILCEDIDGIGFKRADEYALRFGVDIKSEKRISAFIKYYLSEEAHKGNSWINTKDILAEVNSNLGERIDKKYVGKIIMTSDWIYLSEDKQKLGLKRYYNLENSIAKELKRLMSGENDFEYKGWEDVVSKLENNLGFDYTDEQKDGVKTVLENNVVAITGFGGTGKTTIVKAMLEVLKFQSFAQCALAGKAANRMFEVTGHEGYTIHRLLKAQGSFTFEHNEENQLPYDIIILDEASMIGGELFLSLLKAIKEGSKLVIIGDSGQLSSIGTCNVFHDLLVSRVVPSIKLTKIHRQAQKSAIITESIKLRKQNQIISKGYEGNNILGELQDLELDIYLDKAQSPLKIINQFKEKFKTAKSILDIQILVAMKERGDICTLRLNNAIQKFYNPDGLNEMEFSISKNLKYCIREGDKVINMKNNYNSVDIKGVKTPVFNGNIGIVEKINLKENLIVVNFENIGRLVLKKDDFKHLQLAYAITTHKCITEDTWLYTNKGLKQLKDLNNGAEINEFKPLDSDIKVFNGEYMETPKSFYNDGVSECNKITTKRGYDLTCTDNHKINVIGEDGYICEKFAKDITENDYLMISKNQNIYGNVDKLPESFYIKKDMDIRTKIYNKPTNITNDFSRMLGLIVADGTVHKGGVKLSKRYKEVTEDFQKCVKNIFGHNTSIIKKRSSGDYMCEISSVYISNFLQNIDGIHPHNKFVPSCILSASKENQCHFLKGLFEDGSVNVKNGKFDHIELTMKNELLAKQVQVILLNMGIVTTKNKLSNGLSIIYIYKEEARMFYKNIGFISDLKNNSLLLALESHLFNCSKKYIPFIGEIMKKIIKSNNVKFNGELENNRIRNAIRKKRITYDTLNVFLKRIEELGIENKDVKYLNSLYNNFYIDKVNKIEKETKHTYCLEMPETHNFIQNGIYAKNSQGSEWDTVIVGIDYSAYMSLCCEWLYTAITRASKYAVLVGECKAIRYATMQTKTPIKQTFLPQLLKI